MAFDPELLLRYGPLLLAGLWTTLRICLLACLLALALGLLLALLLRLPFRPVRVVVRAYVELMRGMPILVILFLLYYGGPSIGLLLDAEPVGVLGLGCYGAVYFAEIFRAGFASIPRGQIEAARLLGLRRLQVVRRIELPQMLGLVLPPATSQIIILVKESAVLSIIAIDELTKGATRMANETFAVVEPFLAVALLYWLVVEAIARAGQWLERRARHG